MIKYLQTLKRKKGFTMVELIVVIAILAIMMGVILLNIDNQSNKIRKANSAASDFYIAVQSAFTRYMTYPGPLSPEFRENPNTTPYMRYYRGANGNFPFDKSSVGNSPLHPNADSDPSYPAPCTLCIEARVKNGQIVYVNCANGVLANVLAKTGSDDGSEFGRLLKMEIEKRVEYQDGYYYAKISCKPKYNMYNNFEQMDVVLVNFAAFSTDPLKNESTSLTFSGKDYVLQNGEVCGVAAPVTDNSGGIIKIGTPGTDLQ